jgi:hypothetical protein
LNPHHHGGLAHARARVRVRALHSVIIDNANPDDNHTD